MAWALTSLLLSWGSRGVSSLCCKFPSEEGGSAEGHTASGHSASSQNLTYEIILTLGQAFEVAYQLALQAQKSRTMAASAAALIETKASKPVPKPRVGTRKSAVRGLSSTRHPRAWVEMGTSRVFPSLAARLL